MTAKSYGSKFSRRGSQDRFVGRRSARSTFSRSRRNAEQRPWGRRLCARWARTPLALVGIVVVLMIVPYAIFSAMGGFARRSSGAGAVEGGLRAQQDTNVEPIVTPVRPTLPVPSPGNPPETNSPPRNPEVVETERKQARQCKRSSLYDNNVDPSSYDVGCPEIEEMLKAKKELIGNGNIRDIYLAEYEGRKVVVKVLREDFELRASKMRVENIHRWEATALDAVRGHRNIVGMLGMCGTTSVSEYIPNRLDDLILKPGNELLPISRVLSMSLDAARGLQALHEVPEGAIVHYDIKPQQMMLHEDGTLMINDLNMCFFTDIDETGASCPIESPASNPGPWRSPENIAGETLTEKLDVYSLAMVFYAMLGNKPPFMGLKNAHQLIVDGVPPATDPSWHQGYVEILRDMWGRDPKTRLSAKQVVERLESLIETQDTVAIG